MQDNIMLITVMTQIQEHNHPAITVMHSNVYAKLMNGTRRVITEVDMMTTCLHQCLPAIQNPNYIMIYLKTNTGEMQIRMETMKAAAQLPVQTPTHRQIQDLKLIPLI